MALTPFSRDPSQWPVDSPRAGARRAGARGDSRPRKPAQPAAPKPGPAARSRAKACRANPVALSWRPSNARLSEAVRRNPGQLRGAPGARRLLPAAGKARRGPASPRAAQTIDPAHYANGYDLALALLETGKLDRAREQVAAHAGREGDARSSTTCSATSTSARTTASPPPSVSARRAHGSDRRAPVRLGEQPGAASRVRVRDGGLRRGHQAPSEVGQAPRRPRHRAGTRGGNTRTPSTRSARPRISRRRIRAPTSFSARCTASSPSSAGEITKRLARFVKAQPGNALAHFHLRDDALERTACRLAPGRLRAGSRRCSDERSRSIRRSRRASWSSGSCSRISSGTRKRFRSCAPRHALEPGLAQAHYRLAQAYQRTGQTELAAKELEIFEQLKGGSR